jgi:hypothetical protein
MKITVRSGRQEHVGNHNWVTTDPSTLQVGDAIVAEVRLRHHKRDDPMVLRTLLIEVCDENKHELLCSIIGTPEKAAAAT